MSGNIWIVILCKKLMPKKEGIKRAFDIVAIAYIE